MENNENISKDVDFVDENGMNSTLHIDSPLGYKINKFNHGKYKLANSRKNVDLIGVNKKKNFLTRDIGPKIKGTGLFTSDIGFKSSGFAQVAALSFIVALAMLFVMFVMFRY